MELESRVKATFQLASETHSVEGHSGGGLLPLSEQLVNMKETSMGILKAFITKYNIPNDVPDEPLDGYSGEEEVEEEDSESAMAKSKKRK